MSSSRTSGASGTSAANSANCDCGLSDYTASPAVKRWISRFLDEVPNLPKGGTGIFCCGDSGSQRNLLARIVAQRFLDLRRTAVVVRLGDMVDLHVRGWRDSDEKALYDELEGVDCLALLNLGAKPPNELTRACLYEMLKFRRQRCRPLTILTSKYRLESLYELYGEDIGVECEILGALVPCPSPDVQVSSDQVTYAKPKGAGGRS